MTEISKEYANALFMLASESGIEDAVFEALDTVRAQFSDNPGYVEFLASPGISKKERTEAFAAAFAGHIPEPVLSFVQLLCERGHIRAFADCMAEYARLYQAVKQRLPARVISAVPLTDEEKRQLTAKLEKLSGKTVLAEWVLDARLLGGVIVEMDGKVLDGSLRHRLHEVKDVIDR